MGDKRSPTRPKRQPKPSSADEGYWDCSVCTYTNTAEAFKCMMCDVRKGTSTREEDNNNKETEPPLTAGRWVLIGRVIGHD
ncbi:hypothetical protein CRUP_010756 [Coryphaenoides rupestris]|nr:hypothetical protein CRUP_010756 [Coryphaenoides rupestris]